MNPGHLAITRPAGSCDQRDLQPGQGGSSWPYPGSARAPMRPQLEQNSKPTVASTCEPAFILVAGRDPVHARNARRRARVLLEEWDLGEQASLGELVVSELVANAVRHGEMPIWMRLSVVSGCLRVEVHNGDSGRPVRRHATEDDVCGRGLELIDGLIDLHGGERGVVSDLAGPGKTVYVVLSFAITQAGAR